MPDTNAIIVERPAGAIVIRLTVKDLDEVHIAQVRDELKPIADQSPQTPFILDLSTVKFVPSLCLGAMVKLSSEFKARKQRLILASLQRTVQQVLALTRLDRVFEIQPTVEAALEDIQQNMAP